MPSQAKVAEQNPMEPMFQEALVHKRVKDFETSETRVSLDCGEDGSQE